MNSSEAFARRARTHYENHAAAFPHHPTAGYTSLAFRHYHRRALLRQVLRDLEFTSAVDVGCADGFFVDFLCRQYGVGAVGVDIAESAIRRMRETFDRPGAVGDATRLPFADDAFDLAICTETLEHVLDADALVGELRRVARRWIVVTVPAGTDEEPDYDFVGEGHVQSFDRASLGELFGVDARVASYRCNASFALYVGVGRHLGERLGDAFIRFDLGVSERIGTETRPWPLRTRDYVVVALAEA